MNRDHASPESDEPTADDAIDARRVAEIEQQLRRSQPRPPVLDIDALVRTADESNAPADLARPLHRQAGGNSYRRVGLIAGSWVCGVVAGTLVTLIVTARGVPPEASPIVTATSSHDHPQLPRTSDVVVAVQPVKAAMRDKTSKDVAGWSRSELVVAVMLDTHSRDFLSNGGRTPALRAGNSARHRVESGSWQYRLAAGRLPENASETSGDVMESGTAWDIAPFSAPSPSVTRERLRRELLDPLEDSVL